MFDRLSTKLFAAVAAAALLVASFLFGYGVGRDVVGRRVEDFGLLREVEAHIRESAVESVDREQLIEGALRGMVRSLDDPYSEFLDPVTYQTMRDSLASHYSGVGITIKQEGDRHRLVSVLDGTPAHRAGMAPDDVLISVDEKPIAGFTVDELARRIQGTPGTRVKISVLRGEQALDFTLVREQIERSPVNSRVVRDRLGLIEVVVFTEGTGQKVREAVTALSERGARGFILDLRGNPGGDFEESVEVASVFLDGGRVVSYRERGRPEVTYSAKGRPETDMPLVILVDEASASASEIVAGAVQDRGRGIVVGTRTYGKGSIQSIILLSDGSALKLTTASYYTPSGRSIGERGIDPDVKVEDETLQLARAQQILREMVAGRPARAAR